MDRLEFFFRQLVTEKELNLAFDQAEAADRNLAADLGIFGIIAGAEPAPHAPVADLTIDLTAPTRAYDRLGQRIAYGTGQRVDVSRDFQGIPTDVSLPNRERWIALFLRFKRRLSDPRIDGDSKQVSFRHDEACEFVVRQGAEGPAGGAAYVPLEDDELLVCDVRRVGGQSQVLAEHLDLRRRQVFVFAHADSVAIDSRAWKLLAPGRSQLQATLDTVDAELAGHTGGTTRRHNADHIEFAPDALLQSKNVGAAIRELIGLLANTTGTQGPGAGRVGMDGLPGTPYAIQPGSVRGHLAALLAIANDHIGAAANAHAASAIAAAPFDFLQARTVAGQIRELVGALQSTGDGSGAARVGSDAIAGDPMALPAGTLHDQLAALLGHLNAFQKELAATDGTAGTDRVGGPGFIINSREVPAGTVHAQLQALLSLLLAHAGSGDHDARYLNAAYARGEVFAIGEEKVFGLPAWPMVLAFETSGVKDNQPAQPIQVGGLAMVGIRASVTKSDQGYALHIQNASGAPAYINVLGYA